MPVPLTFSFDLEDHRPAGDPWPERFTELTYRVLDWADERDIRGTFFVVGELAEANPGLIASVAARGHELALHHWQHVQLTQMTPEEFAVDVKRGKAMLEDLTGQDVTGYRAPTASLVRSTVWATELLAEAGYTYSSSVIPARNPLFGFDGLPLRPFRWASGLVEFPLHVGGLGPVRLPYMCGAYVRVLPWWVVSWLARTQPWAPGASTYFHPYDLDTDEPFHWLPEAGWMSPLLWWNRKAMLKRLDRLFADGAAPPLAERLALADDGEVIDPAAFADHPA
jgi:peptidoglycan-N-acetylglucosamine deacetylase